MKGLPLGKWGLYSKKPQELENLYEPVGLSLEKPQVGEGLLAKLEGRLVNEALVNAGIRGINVSVTYDKSIYNRRLSGNGETGDNNLLLLCDENGDLQDLRPLFSYVSQETRESFDDLRKEYLYSH